MTGTITLRVFSVLSVALGCFCLYFGTGMLFLVPGGPGERYLDWPMVKYGIAPTILSILLICLAGWLWHRSGGPSSLGTYVKRAFQVAVVAIALLWVGLIISAHLRGQIP